MLEHENPFAPSPPPVGAGPPPVGRNPIRPGGVPFPTHLMREASPTRIEFHYSPLAFAILAGLVGLHGWLLYRVIPVFMRGDLGSGIVVSLVIVALAGGSVYLAMRLLPPSSFDLTRGTFRQGLAWKVREELPLSRIIGVQVVGETVEYTVHDDTGSGTRRFRSYELNVALDDGTRRTVVDHSNRSRVESEALRLATFLNVPLV